MRIYHYTSVDTLGKILSGKSILFRRLDCVDDVMEYTVSEFAKYMFISCWTESKEENIPLWKMYTTDITNGIRISLPQEMFKTYSPIPNGRYVKNQISESLVPVDEILNSDYMVMPIDLSRDKENEIFFRHIEYVRNPQIAVGKIKKTEYNGRNLYNVLEINRLGRYKHKCWEFQQEVRFALTIFPFNPYNYAGKTDGFEKFANECAQMKDLSFSSYFLHLKDDIFDQLEITLSPNISEESRKLVDNLVQQYAPKAIIKESTFHNKVIFK